ncbi:hypothetical protein ANTPLA_LOCUS185 [Anthophora plagiata]
MVEQQSVLRLYSKGSCFRLVRDKSNNPTGSNDFRPKFPPRLRTGTPFFPWLVNTAGFWTPVLTLEASCLLLVSTRTISTTIGWMK